MSFATSLALLIAALVVAPVVAHLLRRRRTQVRDFPPARLVLAARPTARSRARLEDRALFAIRAMSVVALAVLGASPFVRCSRLAVGRTAGGSVALAIVVDDSMSMGAPHAKSTRFARATEGARELLRSLREGDAVAIVTAGAPARVALAATTDLAAARATLEQLTLTDRGTDLDGAVALAASLARALPHPDRRVVVLGDLADGHGAEGRPPLGEGVGATLWAPLDELRGRLPDCGVVRASRRDGQVVATVACGADVDAEGRAIECLSGERVVARAPLARQRSHDVTLALSPDEAAGPLVVRLTGSDAIARDDVAPVVQAGGPLQVAIVADAAQATAANNAPSPAEQALAALDEHLALRPLPALPDDPESLGAYGLVVLDDPAGLTPESRAAFRAYAERGGVALLFLGQQAAGAILGAAFDPFVPGPVRWHDAPPKGIDVASASAFGLAADGLRDLAPRGRALLDARALDGATPLARWSDGAPFALARPLGQGELTVVTLPTSADVSELPLRPAFLHLVDRSLGAARARHEGRRSPVGATWSLGDAADTRVTGPDGPLTPRRATSGFSLTANRTGIYVFDRSGALETRIAEIDEREVDLTPRPVASAAASEALGSQSAPLDVSPHVALALLVAITAEAALRLSSRRDAPTT